MAVNFVGGRLVLVAAGQAALVALVCFLLGFLIAG